MVGVTIKGNTEDFIRAAHRAQVSVWKFIVRAYQAGIITNETLTNMLLRKDTGFAEWFFSGGVDI